MLKFITDNKDLRILHNDHTIIHHRVEDPFALVGTATESIEAHEGNFEIHDDIKTKIPLHRFEILNDRDIRFYYEDYALIVSFVEHDNRLIIRFKNAGVDVSRYWIHLYAEEDEYVYGCGEQLSYFNLRGRNFPIWTSESGVGRDKHSITKFRADNHSHSGGDYYNTYYPEPTFVSSRKYWCHADTYSYCEMDFRDKHNHTLYFWKLPHAVTIEYANDFKGAIEALTNDTGRLPELPEWVHDGVILGVQGGTEAILSYIEQAKAQGVIISGVWCQDWAGINITTFGTRLYWQWQWNEKRYPNLDTIIKDLEKVNIHFIAYICPFLLRNESLYNEAKERGLLALTKEGNVYDVDFGEFFCGIVDFTNPEAYEWYKNVIKTNLIQLGVKGWMADFGEYLPVDCVLHNGKDAKDMHNEWPVLWAKCNYEAVKESDKLGEIVYFMRAGAHGSQRYSLSLWAGDQSVNWEKHDGIPSVIPAALSSGMTGNPYSHSDIGGYTSLYGNIRTKELFERWCEMNVFSAYMRTHEGNRPEQNLQFYDDIDTMQHMAKMTEIRVALKPYIMDVVREGSQKGYPMQRPIFFHYENDAYSYGIQDVFLFGEDILVAPVLEPNQCVKEVHLPNDEWVHFWTGKTYQGGMVEVSCPIGYPPVFYRKQSKHRMLFEQTGNINKM